MSFAQRNIRSNSHRRRAKARAARAADDSREALWESLADQGMDIDEIEMTLDMLDEED